MKSRWLRKIITSLLIILLLAVGVVWLLLRASLPWIDGQFELLGLTQPVKIERDVIGYTTISAENRLDLARATGYTHAQDRFFQMDLLRRSSAGELSELFGSRALSFDKQRRIHRMRARAARVLEQASSDELSLLQAYADGVNAGLNALRAPPFEYLLLRQRPKAWNTQDSVLTALSMYFTLQLDTVRQESQLAMLRDCMPPEMVDFLLPQGTQWDASLAGDFFAEAQLPSVEIFDSQQLEHPQAYVQHSISGLLATNDESLEIPVGSNNWAVGGALTQHGAALVADDMHLGLRLPHIWYRLRLKIESTAGEATQALDISGVSLPGLPFIIVGSNGHVAWGFTNSYGDFLDLIPLQLKPDEPTQYLAADGYESIRLETETIAVNGAEPVQMVVKETRWGPIVDTDHHGKPRVWRWVAHEPEALNLSGFWQLEKARRVSAAVAIAQQTGMPGQNFVVGDASGDIAWTIIGRIPKRSEGFDGRTPRDWSQGDIQWQGWVEAQDYPLVVNPALDRIWTANARVAATEDLVTIGDGGYALGARAGQIRDRLVALTQADEQAMLAIQLDDEALFLQRWRRVLLSILNADAIAGNEARQQLRDAVLNWAGRAAADDAGYRLVREYRDQLRRLVMHGLTAHCPAPVDDEGKRRDFTGSWQAESPLWTLITQRPQHLLPAGFDDWNSVMLVALDQLIEAAHQSVSDLSEYRWGQRNQLRMVHPLATAIPGLGALLEMPQQALAGDRDMPRVQGRSFGASQRMAVSPGHEESGYLQLPGGQSGHPLSPYFAAGHADWVSGEPTPFLPRKTMHELLLLPAQN